MTSLADEAYDRIKATAVGSTLKPEQVELVTFGTLYALHVRAVNQGLSQVHITWLIDQSVGQQPRKYVTLGEQHVSFTGSSYSIAFWECPDCGAVVSDQPTHDAWHTKTRSIT